MHPALREGRRPIAASCVQNLHPHGLNDAEFDGIFTADRPVIFAYHVYPWLIQRLTYRRTNRGNLHARGDKEETTTTPFDMVVCNDLDRFHLVQDVIDRVDAHDGWSGACSRAVVHLDMTPRSPPWVTAREH